MRTDDDSRDWWQHELPAVESELKTWLLHRLPHRMADHDDLVNALKNVHTSNIPILTPSDVSKKSSILYGLIHTINNFEKHTPGPSQEGN